MKDITNFLERAFDIDFLDSESIQIIINLSKVLFEYTDFCKAKYNLDDEDVNFLFDGRSVTIDYEVIECVLIDKTKSFLENDQSNDSSSLLKLASDLLSQEPDKRIIDSFEKFFSKDLEFEKIQTAKKNMAIITEFLSFTASLNYI